jgi:hypothetical protein
MLRAAFFLNKSLRRARSGFPARSACFGLRPLRVWLGRANASYWFACAGSPTAAVHMIDQEGSGIFSSLPAAILLASFSAFCSLTVRRIERTV